MNRETKLKLTLLGIVSIYSLGSQAKTMNFTNQNSSGFIVSLPADSAWKPLTDEQLWQRAAVVKFPVGSAYIPYSDPGFCSVVKAVKAIKDSCVVSRLLVIRGSASPEGGYQNNNRLAHLRARALVKVLSKYIPLPDSLVEERYINEDYKGLQRLLADKPAPYNNKVSDIITQYQGDDARTKQALQRLEGGKVWRQLLRDYFPELRASRIVLFVSKKANDTHISLGENTPLGSHTPLGVPADLQSGGKQRASEHVDSLAADSLLTADCKSAAPPTGQDSLQVETKATLAPPSGHPGLNIKTNVLYDFALFFPQYGYAPTPNLAIEYLPKSGHITPVLEPTWSPWRSDSRSKTWIIHNLLLEGRYYFRSEERRVKSEESGGKQRTTNYTGHYVAVYANTGAYDIQFSGTKGWLSDKWSKNYGFGIGWGYVKRFTDTSRWKWEVNAALGYLHSSYDGYHDAEGWAEPGNTYYNWHENPLDYRRYKNHLNYWGLTRLGFSISYDLF